MKLLRQKDLTGEVTECLVSHEQTPLYRFRLDFQWSQFAPLYFCGLNPSTADHQHVDPTTHGLIKRARQWGYGGLRMINLFAYRATDPLAMKRFARPSGNPDQDTVWKLTLREMLDHGSPMICGWGPAGKHRSQDAHFINVARQMKAPLHALEVNQDGSPKHPLYIKHEIRPTIWRDFR